MELDLLPYLAARMFLEEVPDRAMATLVSPELAVTTAHAVPKSPLSREGQRFCFLEFSQSPRHQKVKATIEATDNNVDFAVLKLEPHLELPTSELVLSAESVEAGAADWHSLGIAPSYPDGIRITGRVEGIETVAGRYLVKLVVYDPPEDIRGFSGAPVIVDDKVIGIVWGVRESEPNQSPRYWYAVPVSEMVKSKNGYAIRQLLNLLESTEEANADVGGGAKTPSNDDQIKALLERLGDNSSEVRLATVKALSDVVFKEPDVRRAVAVLIDDPNKNVRAAALKALTEVVSYDDAIKAAAIKRLEDRSSEVRVAAVLALTSLADVDAEVKTALLGKTTDHNSGVRTAAVNALKKATATDDPKESALDSSTAESGPESDTERDRIDFPHDRVDTERDEAPTSPTETESTQASGTATTPASEPPARDPVSFLGELSPSARRAVQHAAGMLRYLSTSLAQSTGFGEPEIERLKEEPPVGYLPISYLIAGLFENEEGITRDLFLSKAIDGIALNNLIEQSDSIPPPPRTKYSPLKLDKLPELAPETTRAMLAARDKAYEMKAPQIGSRYLLYGALSIKDNKLVTLLAEAGIRQENIPLTDAPAPALTAQTIARLNSDNAEGEDLLDITPDVNALSSVIAAKDVATPLSIGLFGDWGSGKSFFMGKMRERIHKLMTTARDAEGQSAYCDNVIQIEFNAWSYQEGDLWASLITDIFEGLARSIDDDLKLSEGTDPATAKARLLASMASARDVLAEEERRLVAAENELQAGEKQFKNLKRIGTRDVIKGAYRVIIDEPEVKKELDAAAYN